MRGTVLATTTKLLVARSWCWAGRKATTKYSVLAGSSSSRRRAPRGGGGGTTPNAHEERLRSVAQAATRARSERVRQQQQSGE